MTATYPRSFLFIALISKILTFGSVTLSAINFSSVLLYTGGGVGILTICYHLAVVILSRQSRNTTRSPSSKPLHVAASTPGTLIGCGILVMWAILLSLQVEVVVNGPTRSAFVVLEEEKGTKEWNGNVQKLLPFISGIETMILIVYVWECFIFRMNVKLERWEIERRISEFPFSTTSSISDLSDGDEEKGTVVSDVIWDLEPPKVQRSNSTSPRVIPKSDQPTTPYTVYSPNRSSLARLPRAKMPFRRARQPQWEYMTPRIAPSEAGSTQASERGVEGQQYDQR